MSRVIGFRISDELFVRIKNCGLDIREIMRHVLIDYMSRQDSNVNRCKQGVNSVGNENRYETIDELVDRLIRLKNG